MEMIINLISVYSMPIVIFAVLAMILATGIKSRATMVVILLVLGAFIFWTGTIVRDQSSKPIQEIENTIDSLKQDILRAEAERDSVRGIERGLQIQVDSIKSRLLNNKQIIQDKKKTTNEKIIAIDNFTDAEIDEFFTNYRKFYFDEFLRFDQSDLID